MKKRYLFSFCCLLALAAQAQVNYIERSWDAGKREVVSQTKTCTTFQELTGENSARDSYGSGWYVVKGNFSRFQVTFDGDVHLILADGCKMTAKGIVIEADNKAKLHIYSQSDGDNQGKLEVSNDYFDLNAGMGARESHNMGSLYIHGGDIRVIQDKGYAAIGGGDAGQIDPKSEMIVYGGKLYAKSGTYGAAIGGGFRKNQGGPITVYGGTVEAVAGRDGAGIGGGRFGDGGTVNVYGGKVTARGANAIYYGSTAVAGAGIGGGMAANGGEVYVHGGEVYAYGGYGASGIGGSYTSKGGTLEVAGGVVFASSNENDKWVAPAIGGGMYGDGVKVIVSGGVLMAVTKQNSSLRPAPIGAGSYDGGHLYYSNTEIRLADNVKVSYSEHPDAIRDAQYRQGQHLHGVSAALREEACQNHAYTFVRIESCPHKSYTYTAKDNEKHVRQCSICNYKVEEAHSYKDGKCICGKADEVSDYWTVSFYYTTDGKTYVKGDEYQVIKGMGTTLPIAPKVDGLTFVGYASSSDTAPAGIEMTESEQHNHQLIAAGTLVEASANTAYYARYRYNYTENWSWNSSFTEASVTLNNPLLSDPVKVTATVTEDTNARVEPTEDKLGEAHYKATATYAKPGGISYYFEDRQKVTLRQLRIVILDAFDTEGRNAELLEQYDGFEAEVVINNLTIKKDGQIHSICLPFNLTSLTGTPLEGARIYQYSGWAIGNELTISFLGSTGIEAGKPYFYQFANAGENIEHPTFSPVIIADSDGSGKFETNFDLLGTYEIMTFADEVNDQIVVFDGSKFIHRPETIDAFSSYFYIVPNIDTDGCRKITALKLDFINFGLEFSKKLFDSWAGMGTQASPYIISSVPLLKEMQEAFAASDAARLTGKYFRQGANISFDKNVENNFTPIATFTAHYDGDGYAISGLNINRTGSDNAALILAMADGSTVNNVIIKNSSIQGSGAAALVYNLHSMASIENCHVLKDVSVTANYYYAGGVVAFMNNGTPSVKNCSSQAQVTASQSYAATTLTDIHALLMLANNADNTASLTLLKARDEYLKDANAALTAGDYNYDLTLNGRTFYKDEKWNTICLPFSVSDFTGSPLQGATVKALTASSFADGTLTMTFTDATSIDAGKPYLVKWASGSNVVNPTFSGVTVSATEVSADETASVNFEGILAPIDLAADNRSVLYLGADNKLYYPKADVTVGAFRGYFLLQNGLTVGDLPNGVRSNMPDFGDDDVTGIFQIENRKSRIENANGWFTLDGRRLSGKPTTKGIYIHKGHKMNCPSD